LDKFDLSALETILYGGSPIPIPVLREAKKKLPHVGFRQTFASTETGLKGTVLEPAEHELALNDPEWEHLLVSCGRPQTNVQVAIWDVEGNELPFGSVGDIAVRSEANIAGFWNNATATAESIVNGWVLTGDVARMDEEGYFYLVDRKKDMIVTGAFNVYPSEVERVLQLHPAVYEVAAIGIPSEQWGEAIKACVVLRPQMSASEEDIISFCEGKLAGYKKPKTVDFVASLPRNPTGKVLHRQLREKYWQNQERTIG
jgi:fatty-acyl-CoA synthase